MKGRYIFLINSQTFKNFASSVFIPRGVSNGGFCNMIVKTKVSGSTEYDISFAPNSPKLLRRVLNVIIKKKNIKTIIPK